MKILFLQDDFPPKSFGGAGISTFELALGMKKAGHEVFVFTSCQKKEEEGWMDYKGLKIFKAFSNYSLRWRWYISLNNRPMIKKLLNVLKKIQPDIVHANNIHTYISYRSIKISKKYSSKVIFTARDVMVFNFAKLTTKRYLKDFDCRTTWFDHFKQAKKRWNPLRNFFIRKYLNYADKVFAISQSLKRALEQNKIRGVEVIYNGLDLDKWNIDSEKIDNFKFKNNLENKKVLLFSGRLSEAKGGLKIIQALPHIMKEVPEAVLVVVGGVDDYATVMQKEARRLGVNEKIIFTGWIDREKIMTIYGVADVVLMPSICLDAFGRVNIEAMASKKPVIGTCYGGTPEVVEDGVTGYIINPMNSKEIVDKSIELLKNPEKSKNFGEAGFDRLERMFNLESKVQEYLEFYKKD